MFSPVRIADFLLQKDRLFAELNLDPHELGLYQQVADTLELDPPTPDLVVYLQAPAPVLLKRVAARGIPYEQLIEPGVSRAARRRVRAILSTISTRRRS